MIEKATGSANFRPMEKMQAICYKLTTAKEEISRLIKLTLLDSGKGGKLDSKIEAIIEELELFQANFSKPRKNSMK